ncbi:AfsR/SARP family transcriptional regulator [Streptomyces platensis]|uniref:AfsR/SARP family transcriptional regulator n=1 Tax=Streptomyces platensis TaxID=58346 RepID=UPI00225ABD88|nr:BTAD domain-containing putative transcriptional regulator [Streptomyces platensis]MCX4635655.1 AfsR/SARP family transcriptional regulator [Streptomyces platensis]
MTIDQLVDGLYHDDPPASARRVIVNYVHRLRTYLDRAHTAGREGGAASGRDGGATVIGTMADGYVLRLPAERVDALLFGQLTLRARRAAAQGDPAYAASVLKGALGMWQGPALAGLPGPYAQEQRRALAEQRASATEHHLELSLACGRHEEVVPEILCALEAYPYRERLHGALMLALYRSERSADALLAYDHARQVLADEMGIDTGPVLDGLHAAVLAGDRTLLAVPATARTAAVPAEVQVWSAVPAPRAPAQLPAVPCDFTGRHDEVCTLVAALSGHASHPVAVITGMGGVGKTALALRTGHAVMGSFPDGQLYAELRTPCGAPGDPADVLAGFLTSLGVPHERLPASVSDRAALFRTLLSDRAVLVVLDNAATVAQVEPLLPGADQCAVLVTARALAALPAAVKVSLKGLDPHDSVELIGKVAGIRRIEEEPDAVAALAAASGHLPLALRAIGARLALRPAWPVATLLSRMSDEARLLGELRVGELTVEAVFEQSYAQLSPQRARAFLELSLPHCVEFGVKGAAAVLELPEREVEDVLEALVDAVLLETRAPGRYRYHDLVGAYARATARVELTDEELRQVVRRAADFMCASVAGAVLATQPLGVRLTSELRPRRSAGEDVGTGQEAVQWMRRALPTVAAVAEQAAGSGDAEAVALAVDGLMLAPCFEESVPLGMLAPAATALVRSAVAYCDEDVVGTAHYAAGVILKKHSSLDCLDRSRAHLLKALEIFGESPAPADGLRPFLAVLFTHAMLAHLDAMCADFSSARAHAERSVEMAMITGDQGLVTRRRTLLLQIRAQDPGSRGDLARIREQCRELADLLTCGKDVKWLIRVMTTEADTLLYGGRPAEAAALYRQVLPRARTTGHARNETECLYRLAEALLLTGDAHAAVDHARQALQGAQLTQEHLLMARSHQALGRALQAVRAEYVDGEAAGHLEKAAELYRVLGLHTGSGAAVGQ